MPFADAKYPSVSPNTFTIHGERTTKVVLANGQTLLVIESEDSVVIALSDMRVDAVDKFVCRIQPQGVMVYPDTDYACLALATGGYL